MSTQSLTSEILSRAINNGAAAFRCRRKLQPGGGPGDKVFPPTFAGAVYAVEQRRVPGRPDTVTCVVLDTVQSQANRMESALQEALDAGRIKIPVVKVDFSAWSPTGNKPETERLIDDVGTITSLQVPHRLADAILRDSQIEEPIHVPDDPTEEDAQKVVDAMEIQGGRPRLPRSKWVPFRNSRVGRALNAVSTLNATALYEICPTALIFGMWDSTGPKGGLGAKFERAMVSEVIGIGASVQDSHRARGVRRDPLEIRKAVSILKAADKSWSLAEGKAKGAESPSSINHGSVPFDSKNAGTTIEYAEQLTTLSLIALRRLRFPNDGKSKSGTDTAGHTVLAALGLCAATLAFESGMGLRSRCLLWPEGVMEWELLEKPGAGGIKQFTLTGEQAVGVLKKAVATAAAAGLKWEETPIELVPQQKLVDLVRLSQLEATKEDSQES